MEGKFIKPKLSCKGLLGYFSGEIIYLKGFIFLIFTYYRRCLCNLIINSSMKVVHLIPNCVQV